MKYQIETFENKPVWHDIKTILISNFPWDNNGYRPVAKASLCYINTIGLCARLWCYEENPRTVHMKPDSPVYQDSCLEFFIQPEDKKNMGYLNFEMNSAGTLLCQFGSKINGRHFINDLGFTLPIVKPFKGTENNESFWGVELVIPDAVFFEAYGIKSLHKGMKLKGNFYKCGDLTEKPHYGCWSSIANDTPDFHLEEFFGDIIL